MEYVGASGLPRDLRQDGQWDAPEHADFTSRGTQGRAALLGQCDAAQEGALRMKGSIVASMPDYGRYLGGKQTLEVGYPWLSIGAITALEFTIFSNDARIGD